MKPTFSAGQNIAMKVPSHEFDSTVAFYRDILGFEPIPPGPDDGSQAVVFQFGDKRLWIDKMPGLSQAEIWLEVVTDNIEMASAYLNANHCVRRDDIEALPTGFEGFWISSPANIIHLINQ